MGMTQSLDLVAVEPDGSEHPARIGYSSDLKAFALMTYGPYGESGQVGITSWYPLPTRTIRHSKEFGPSAHIKHAENAVDPGHKATSAQRAGQTLFKVLSPLE